MAPGETFRKTAIQACIPQLLPKNELTQASSLFQMINSVCTMISPMLGAVLMSIPTIASAPIGTFLPLIINGHFNGADLNNGFVEILFSIGMLVYAMVVAVTFGIKKYTFTQKL